MKSKLTILSLGLVLFLSHSGFVLAHEGMKHDEGMEAMDHEKDSMMGHEEETEANSKAVEVGNKICPVSGDKVGEMGDIVKYEYNGKIYNFCCKACVKDFKKDPEKYSKIAEEEVKAQGEGEMSDEKETGHADDGHSGHDHNK